MLTNQTFVSVTSSAGSYRGTIQQVAAWLENERPRDVVVALDGRPEISAAIEPHQGFMGHALLAGLARMMGKDDPVANAEVANLSIFGISLIADIQTSAREIARSWTYCMLHEEEMAAHKEGRPADYEQLHGTWPEHHAKEINDVLTKLLAALPSDGARLLFRDEYIRCAEETFVGFVLERAEEDPAERAKYLAAWDQTIDQAVESAQNGTAPTYSWEEVRDSVRAAAARLAGPA